MAQEKERGLFALLSQSLFIAQDKVKDRGEDSYLIGFRENAGVCAVFDGLGGSGSRQYKEYGDKTGAYIASRAVSEEMYNWFLAFSEDQNGLSSPKIAKSLHERIDKRNHEYQNFMILLLEVFLLLLVLPLVSYAVIKIIRSKQNYGIMSSLPDDSGILKVNSLNYGNVGCVDSCGFLSVLVNLINRGYLVIDNSENPYNTNLTLSRKDRSDLKRYELMVLEYTGLVNLFDSSFGYKVKKDKKELLDSLDPMEGIDLGLKALEDHYFDFYLSRRDDFGRFMSEFSKATVDEESISADGYFDDTLFKIHKIISYFVLSVVLIVAVITLLGVLFYGIQFIGLILVLLLLYVPVFLLSRPSTVYSRWTKKGAVYHNEWMEFREYLTDEDAIRANPPEDIDEWLKYMEYAAALGVLPRFSKITRDYFNMSIRPANEFSEYSMFVLIYHMMCRYYLFYGRYDGRYITQSMIGGTLKKYRDENPLIWSKIKEYVY